MIINLEMKEKGVYMKMNSKLIVFTIGWSPQFVVKALMNLNLSPCDELLLIGTEPLTDYANEMYKRTLQELEGFFRLSGIRNYTVEFIKIGESIENVTLQLISTVTRSMKIEHEKLIFALVGGMRILVVSGLLAALALASFIDKVDLEVLLLREDAMEIVLLDPAIIKVISEGIDSVPRAQRDILLGIYEKGMCDYYELAKNRSPVTVRRLVQSLRAKGLIICKKTGKRNICKLTKLGELVAFLVKLRKSAR